MGVLIAGDTRTIFSGECPPPPVYSPDTEGRFQISYIDSSNGVFSHGTQNLGYLGPAYQNMYKQHKQNAPMILVIVLSPVQHSTYIHNIFMVRSKNES